MILSYFFFLMNGFFLVVTHPFHIVLLVLFISFASTMFVYLGLGGIWFSCVFVLVFLGGIMIMFVYISSLVPNEWYEGGINPFYLGFGALMFSFF